MKQEAKADRRIIRTKRLIKQAFIELLMEKELSQITVKELAEKADVNRKTFYAYYANIEGILNAIEDEIIEKVLSELYKFDFKNPTINALEIFTRLNDIIYEDFKLYQRLYRLDSLDHLVGRIKDAIIEMFLKLYDSKCEISRNEFELYAEYFVSGILSMYIKWFSLEPSIPLERLTQMAGLTTFKGFQPLIKLLQN